MEEYRTKYPHDQCGTTPVVVMDRHNDGNLLPPRLVIYKRTDLGVYAIVVAMIIYAVVMCLLNERAMKQYMQYKNPWNNPKCFTHNASPAVCVICAIWLTSGRLFLLWNL